MVKVDRAFSGFSVNDLDVARDFYGQTLGLPIEESPAGIRLKIGNGILIYPKEDHQPSTYTMLNFPVENIDQAVDELVAKGITFEHYGGITDKKSVARGLFHGRGPHNAWFEDTARHIPSVLPQSAE